MEIYGKILQKNDLFKDMSDKQFSETLKNMNARVRHYKKGDLIVDCDQIINKMGIIVKGNAYAYFIDINGNRMILRELGIGHSFGESVALIGIENPILITAIANCSVVFLSLEKIINNIPFNYHETIRNNLIKIICHKNIALILKNDIISKKKIRERLIAFFYYHICSTNSTIINSSLTKEELADYLCINRSAMGRELSQLIKDGILIHSKGNYKINVNNPIDLFK